MKRRLLIVLLLLVFGVRLGNRAYSRDYVVEFDCFDDAGTSTTCQTQNGVGMTIGGDVLHPWRGWGSYGHRLGSRLVNGTGVEIKGIWIRTAHAADNFIAGPIGGGNLFGEVWKSGNGTEMIFNVAAGQSGVRDGIPFWSRVLPRSPGFPNPYFDGYAAANPIPIPTDGEWTRVEDVPAFAHQRVAESPKRSEVWKALLSALPKRYQSISVYGESQDGQSIIFLSGKDLFWYSTKDRDVKFLVLDRPIPNGVNRIGTEAGEKGEELILWKDGESVARVQVGSVRLGSSVSRGKEATSNGDHLK